MFRLMLFLITEKKLIYCFGKNFTEKNIMNFELFFEFKFGYFFNIEFK